MHRLCTSVMFLFLWQTTTGAQQTTFTHRPAGNGQDIWQHVTFFANTMTTYEQGGQKISQRHVYITREQVRRVTILDASPGPANRVQVTYEKAQVTRSQRGRDAKIEPQPVSGKSYVVMRPEQEIAVFDLHGEPVPETEAVIVRENMQFVGKPNPLAQFLHGRTLQLGEEVHVPRELAQEMLGWKSNYGQVDRVTLTLRRVTPDGIAILDTVMVGLPVPQLSNNTELKGQLHVAVDTCRTTATNLKADLAIHKTRGPEGHTFTVSHEGQANIHTQARFLQ
jgi:hypothetical protein